MAEFRGGTTAEQDFAAHEHRDLAPGIDRIHAVARAVGSIAPSDWSGSVLDVIDWVEGRGYLFALEALLRAHIEREERFLIPLFETAVDETARKGRSQ